MNSPVRPHVKDQVFSGTVVPWHGSSVHIPDPNVMCSGTLTTTQDSYADVTKCDTCKYSIRWGIGD